MTELEADYRFCKQIALGHYENFPVGSLLIEKKDRHHFYALYAYMRTTDDIADSAQLSRLEKLQQLAHWRTELEHINSGLEPVEAISRALAATLREKVLPIELLHRLLDAFEFDARGEVIFETASDLAWYTARSAEPVGELILRLFAQETPTAILRSNAVCSALQVINFMQDIEADLAEGRLYFPKEDIRVLSLTLEDLSEEKNRRKLIAHTAERTRQLMDFGKQVLYLTHGRLRLELRVILLAADKILTKLRKYGNGKGDARRLRLSTWEKRLLFVEALAGRRPRFRG